jgi:hypothetical protein
MAIIETDGLFKGKRLRKCSADARWRWPYLFLLSNGYARIELDYECMADEFSSFREFAPTPDELREAFAEFQANHLIFFYTFNDQAWGQWDTRRSLLKEYKTAGDKGSPAPPEPEYRRWLIEQHGNDWTDFHWNKDIPQGTSDTDSPKTLPNIDHALPKVFQQIETEPYGVGVGEGEGEGEGEGIGKESKPLAHSPNEREGVDSVDVSPGDAPKSKNLTAAKRAPLVANLYSRYPRKVAKADAFKAIEKAIVLVAKRDFAGDEEAAAEWLGSRVDLYARSPQALQPDKSKVPYPASWFNGARYDDDEAEWRFVVGANKSTARAEVIRNAEQDPGFTEVLSRPDPAWVEAGS